MIKVLLRLIGVLVAFAVVVVIVGNLLPREYDFQTSREIAAQPAEVFSMINELPNWQQWARWNPTQMDGLENVQYGELKAGKGAVQMWSDPRGSGKLWITDSVENQSVQYKLKFGDFPEMNSRIVLEPKKNGTLVTWSSKGRLPDGAFYGYTAFIFSTQMQYLYEDSLEQLAKILE